MEFQVNVTLNLGAPTIALLNGIVGNFRVETPAKKLEEKPAEQEKPAAPVAKPAVAKPAAPAPVLAKTAAPSFADLDDDAKLEKIKEEVTRHTKNKKGADIKSMLAQFDAARASELPTENYDAFFDAIKRYGKGESMADIFPEENLS